VKQQPASRLTELLVQRPWESDTELHGPTSPGGSSRHAASRLPLSANYCTARAPLASRRYDDDDDAGINYPIAAANGLFPVSGVLPTRRQPRTERALVAPRTALISANARQRIVMEIVYGQTAYVGPISATRPGCMSEV